MILFIILTILCWIIQIITYFRSLYNNILSKNTQKTRSSYYDRDMPNIILCRWTESKNKAIAMMIPWGFIYVLYKVIIENTK